MGSRTSAALQAKHYKALELFEEGFLSIGEIAKTVGIPERMMYWLFEGNAEKAGSLAHLFKEELEKITNRSNAKIKQLTKDNKKLALYKINEFLRKQQKKKADPTMMRELVKIMNSHNKMTPGVEIGAFNYTKGLSPEDLRHEFDRLTAIARSSLNPRGVPSIEQGEPGSLPDLTSGRDTVSEE